jgi:CBS-domain-containing membrane protein
VAATVVVEGLVFAGGVLLYATGTRPTRRAGSVVLWALVAFLVAMTAANQLATPPGESAVAWGTLSMWLLVAWMSWVDRLRQPAGLAAVSTVSAAGERGAP